MPEKGTLPENGASNRDMARRGSLTAMCLKQAEQLHSRKPVEEQTRSRCLA